MPIVKPPVNTPAPQTTIPPVQLLNRLLLEHQQKMKNSSVNSSSSNSSTSSPNSIDLSAILRALLAKQNQHNIAVENKVTNITENSPVPPSSTPPPLITSQLPSESSSTTTAL